MSMEIVPDASAGLAGPELTALGKRIEMLRIDRGISKQHLARYAGTSRQQLWRVMTGKSELTGSLRERLAEALRVEPPSLHERPHAVAEAVPAAPVAVAPHPQGGADAELALYLANADAIAATLRTMPGGSSGRRLKRAYLDALEDAALEHGLALDARVFDLRRAVVLGEL